MTRSIYAQYLLDPPDDADARFARWWNAVAGKENSMDQNKLAEKLYQAFHRTMGVAKIPAFDVGAPNNAGWLHVAEIAIANLDQPVTVEHDSDGIHVKRGDEIVWEWSPGPLKPTEPEEEGDDIPEEALLDVLADVDDAIACAIVASNFEALRWLIGYKAQLLGVA